MRKSDEDFYEEEKPKKKSKKMPAKRMITDKVVKNAKVPGKKK